MQPRGTSSTLWLVGEVTHRLGNYLNQIGADIMIARHDSQERRVIGRLDDVLRTVEESMSELRRIREVLRLAAGLPVELRRITIDRAGVLRLLTQFSRRERTLKVHAELPADIVMNADPELLVLAVRNMVDEALLASQSAGADITATHTGNDLVIAVTYRMGASAAESAMDLLIASQIALLHNGFLRQRSAADFNVVELLLPIR